MALHYTHTLLNSLLLLSRFPPSSSSSVLPTMPMKLNLENYEPFLRGEWFLKAPLNCQWKKPKLATLSISRCCSSLERISNGAIFHFSTVYVNRKLWNWDVSCVEVLTQNWVQLSFSNTISRFFFSKEKNCIYSMLYLDDA